MLDPATLEEASRIVEDVRRSGEIAIRHHSEELGDLGPGERIAFERSDLERAVDELDPPSQDLLERVAGRISDFAQRQRECLTDLTMVVPGGRGGHRWLPVETAGAYAPGGRHPLPSSVLMTVIPARVADVAQVWVASPRPTLVTMAAAGIAGATGLLAIGGAQAIAALAFGTLSPASELIVGPGNRWVTAAKKHLYGEVGVDGLAGPSEILVIADEAASSDLVAADLIAQAEHDTDAMPILVTWSEAVADAVDEALAGQLADLPTSGTASAALENGICVLVDSADEAIEISDHIAPEHLALHVADPMTVAERLRSYGSLFVGRGSAEAFADYGAGPNHVLPTGGGARYQSGLSVSTFLRSPTWLELDDPSSLVEDTTLLARLEGLEGHARAAALRS
jgi:phosphoribosyl-ATP pyrophosphohydrolase/phosphoribosyl-AMP cyclohydrolase/histidinol dehydrogenase